MQHFNPQTLDTAFVRPGTPMLSDVVAMLHADTTLAKTRKRDLVSAVSRVARVLNRPPEAIPADPRWLRPRLSDMVPAGIGLTVKSWSNLRSDLQAALTQVGITRRPINRRKHLSPAWSSLWGTVLETDDKTIRISLSAFIYFLSGQGVAPDEVRTEHALAFRDALDLNEISRNPATKLSNTVGAWNLAIQRIPGWPAECLSAPARQKRVKIAPDELPKSFHLDLDRFISTLESPCLFNTNGPLKALRPSTIRVYRARIERFVGALVSSGLPREEIRSLGELVVPSRVEQGLRWMVDRNNGKTSVSILQTAQLMSTIGRSYTPLDENGQEALKSLVKKVTIDTPSGLTEKNRARLRPLQDPLTRRKLLLLPEKLVAEAEQMPEGPTAARMTERAVAIAILTVCPIRVHNLASIHLERNLQRFGKDRVYLSFGAQEMKNQNPIEIELPKRVVSLIDRHLAARRITLCEPDNLWLFPRREGREAMSSGELSAAISRTILQKTGIKMNAHLFRHFAARRYLERYPGQYEAVRRLLGHKSLSQTLDAYAGFEADTAVRLFGDIIDAELQS